MQSGFSRTVLEMSIIPSTSLIKTDINWADENAISLHVVLTHPKTVQRQLGQASEVSSHGQRKP